MKRSDRRFLTLGGTLAAGGRSGAARAAGRRTASGLRRLGASAIVLGSVLSLAALRVAAADPAWVEETYARRIAPAVSLVLTSQSARLPFSLAEVVVLSLPLVVAYRFARAFMRIRARRSRRTFGHRPDGRPNLVAEMGLLAALLLFAAATFYGAWGLNYARPPLEARLGWTDLGPSAAVPADARAESTVFGAAGAAGAAGSVGDLASATDVDARELQALAEQLVDAANRSYERLHGTVDLGRPSALSVRSIERPIAAAALVGEPRRDRDTLDEALDAGYAVAADELGLSPDVGLSRGPAKAVAASALMSRLGLAGFYFPWTGEANYNRDMPGFQLPHTIAHEKAHQRGIGGEDEANFLAYVAGLRSPSLFAQYSAELFGQRQLLRELHRRDPAAAEALIEARLGGVQRDVDAANAFWRRFDGRPAELQREANDAYLRFNGVEEGIEAYARSARLIVRYARANGGRAMGYLGTSADGPSAPEGAGGPGPDPDPDPVPGLGARRASGAGPRAASAATDSDAAAGSGPAMSLPAPWAHRRPVVGSEIR